MNIISKMSNYIIKTTLIATLVTGSFNYVVDPYGAFGDKYLKMHKYDLNNNQKFIKIEYLDKNYKNFNTYIMGGSKAYSLVPEKVNSAYKSKNVSSYMLNTNSGEFWFYENTIKYIVENYEVENILLQLSVLETQYYGKSNWIGRQMHYKVEGTDKYLYYKQFLTMNLNHTIDKLNAAKKQDDYTIGDLWDGTKRDEAQTASVIKKHGEEYYTRPSNTFNDAPSVNSVLYALDENLEALKRIVDFCNSKGVNLILVSAPTSNKELEKYPIDALKDYMVNMASICPYWNFTGYNDFSDNYWNFYNTTHYRKEVGAVMLSKMTGKKVGKLDLQEIPENFGVYITPENAEYELSKAFTKPIEIVLDEYNAEEGEYKYGMKFGENIWD